MNAKRLLLKAIVIFSLVGLSACSDDDANSSDSSDTGVTAPDSGHDHDHDADDDHDHDTGHDDDDGHTADTGHDPDTTGEDIDESDDDASDTVEAECAPETEARAEIARGEVAQNEGVNIGEVTFDTDGDIQLATLDASSGGAAQMATTSYVYLDLDTSEKLDLSDVDAFEDGDWDIAFNRTMIRLNNADSGPGGWMAARVDANWEEAAPPSADGPGWATDTFVADDCEVLTEGRDFITTAFGVWYDYNPETHAVTVPEETTWIFYNMFTHSVLKFQIETYDGGSYEIRWAPFDMGH